ncbi:MULTISPECIES: mannose-1-phosphate guanylyltransferase/mannose-6-phosphate isomerase [Sphingomonas]|uniref:mannose-1-phosphate guanylyltransferase/mannose-6-phosphate isomerase n=1 Tax=Sphingomonas TaxID=13687 RepID=UPI000DEFF1FE|nr:MULTISPECIES: mannose-1-phosphate guanylyltransferase/mannose-6-phosphate isomerase [Sphingomonas]
MSISSSASTRRIRPVILCGGMGARLWPVSRAQFPKQLADLGSGRSLLQETVARVTGPHFDAPLLVSGEEHRFVVRDQIADMGVEPACLLLEKTGRNTAPAVALAAEWLQAHDPDAIMLVLPSDHVIDDEAAFLAAIGEALAGVAAGQLVTFGIAPSRPETGYGYLKVDADGQAGGGVRPVERFVEKPPLATAEEYLRSGDYYWNAGIFLFGVGDVLAELTTHAPEVAAWAHQAIAGGSSDCEFFRPAEENDASPCPAISIDYAVMERSARISMVPVDPGWSDLGSWNELWSRAEQDGAQNAMRGQAVAVDCRGSLLFGYDGMTVAGVGLDEMIVVATRDAVLVAPKARSQDVRAVVDELKDRGEQSGELPTVIHRPWGTYQTTDRDERFQTKRIVVKPGGKLSSQLHHHRSEHWVVVAGTAEVTVGEKTFLLYENQSTYISAGTVHRLANPGKVPLHLVEVQCGTYLGEDDIVRFDDVYGRAPATDAEA